MLLVIMILKIVLIIENLIALLTVGMLLTLVASCSICIYEKLQVSYT